MRRRRRGDDEEEQTFAETSESSSPARQRLTPVDVQQKVFRLSFRGYNERDVDEFLDQVTEDLAALHEENKRVRESLQDAGGAPAALSGAQGQAEQIVRQAREHAAKLVEDAERRAAEIRAATPTPTAAGPASELPATFLAKERDFLKRLAAMVQDHARSLKEEVARTKGGSGGGSEIASPEPSALAFAQRAVEAEEREEMPTSTDAAAERRPPPSERGTPESPRIEPPPIATAAGPVAAPAPVPFAAATATSPEPEPASTEPPDRADTAGTGERPGPWGPASAEPGEAAAGGLSAPEGGDDRRDDADPLISAWESAFLAGGPEAGAPTGGSEPAKAPAPDASEAPPAVTPPAASEAPPADETRRPADEEPRRERRDEEPSLKELFWGEQ